MNLEKVKEALGEKFSRDADFLNSVISELNLSKNSKILDIGTGWGFMAITLALHDYKVITGEPESAIWAGWRTRAKIANVEKNINFKPFYAENIPFEDNSFDAVFPYTSLHHIEDKTLEINETLRVLKDQGHLIIIELTKEGANLIKKRHVNHPNAVNPNKFTQKFGLEAIIKKSKYLNAYIYKNNPKN